MKLLAKLWSWRPVPTQEAGAVFIGMAVGTISDQIGMPWWKSTSMGLLVWLGLLGIKWSHEAQKATRQMVR
jgi:hypothetical protein